MIVGEIIDLDNHNEIVKFMKNQSDKIKKLEKENEQLKNNIKEAYLNERTQIGKNVLKQLMETIQ